MDFRTGELIRRLERDLDALVTQVAALSVALSRAEDRITELEQRAERRHQNGNRQRHTAGRD